MRSCALNIVAVSTSQCKNPVALDTHDTDHEQADIDPRDHVPQPGGRLTGATVATVRDSLRKGNLIFRLDDDGIARHFAQAFSHDNVWQLDWAQVRDVIANLDGCPDVPEDLAVFPGWVRKELLEFEYLPRKKLAELYDWASEDLGTIEANIRFCEAQIATVEARKPKTETDESDIRFYQHFIKLNREARDEIIDVLTHHIHREALSAAYGPLFPFDMRVPWDFRWFPDRYDARMYSPIRHAFLELPILKCHAVQLLYAAENWQEFDQVLVSYIADTKPADRIKWMLTEHHLLARRKTVIEPALDAYKRGELALFASAVAVQIEGIFEDACHLSGVSLEELRTATLIPKLDALIRKSDVRIDYAYYAFKFPILRNRVAHGRLLEPGIERTAALLLLDLADACHVVQSHPAAINAIVPLLRSIASPPSIAEILKFAMLYAQSDGVRPDNFYGVDETFDQLVLLLDTQILWDFLERLVDSNKDELDAGLWYLGHQLRKLRPTLGKCCRDLVSKLGDTGKGIALDNSAFNALVGQTAGHDLEVQADFDYHGALLSILQTRLGQVQSSDTSVDAL